MGEDRKSEVEERGMNREVGRRKEGLNFSLGKEKSLNI